MTWQKWALIAPLLEERNPVSPRKSQAGRPNWWLYAYWRPPQYRDSILSSAKSQLQVVAEHPRIIWNRVFFPQWGLIHPHHSCHCINDHRWQECLLGVFFFFQWTISTIWRDGWRSWLGGAEGNFVLTTPKRIETRNTTKHPIMLRTTPLPTPTLNTNTWSGPKGQ